MRILNEVLREPITEEIQLLMQKPYDAGRTQGREEAGAHCKVLWSLLMAKA